MSKTRFIKIPNYLLKESILSSSELYTLSILLTYQSMEDKTSFPSLETLVKDWGGTISYHDNIVHQLQDKGIIKITKKKYPNSQNLHNVYHFNFDNSKDFTKIDLPILQMVKNNKEFGKKGYFYYSKIVRYANYSTKIWKNKPISTLSKIFGCCEVTVRRNLKRLEKLGLIKTTYTNKKMIVTIKLQTPSKSVLNPSSPPTNRKTNKRKVIII